MKTDYAAQMQRFGLCNKDHGTAIDQPGEYIHLQIIDGIPTVIIDGWSWMSNRGFIDEEFDVDEWEACRLFITPSNTCNSVRTFWYRAFGTARALVNDMAVKYPHVPSLSIEEHVFGRLYSLRRPMDSVEEARKYD